MKKALFLIWLMLLATAIFAQSSLYDLKFDDSATATISRLKAKGFVETSHGDKYYEFNGGKNPDLPVINLYLDYEGTSVISWKLKYDLTKNPSLADVVLASLKALHGDCSVEDDYDYDYIWYFSNDKALYVDLYTGDSMVLDYTTGNWDDDDYYYYYEDY